MLFNSLICHKGNKLYGRCGAQHNGLVGHEGDARDGQLIPDLLD